MEKREKILVAGMVLALLYGGYEVVLPKFTRPEPKTQAAAQTELNTAVNFAKKVVAPSPGDELKNHVIALAEASVNKDPFAGYPREKDKGEKEAEKIAGNYDYTGFVTIGESYVAIINGQEYQVGDLIDGLKIAHIDTEKVVLETKNGPVSIPILGRLE